jgi:hypothetical protein
VTEIQLMRILQAILIIMRACRIDANQNEIVSALRKAGASVLITSQLKNCFDCLVGYNGVNYIVEIKDGSLTPSKRKLTEGEQKFADNWKGGKYYIIESIEDAIKMIKE